MLECYYDIARAEEFDTLFADTYIQAHPTPEKNAYLILKFNWHKTFRKKATHKNRWLS